MRLTHDITLLLSQIKAQNTAAARSTTSFASRALLAMGLIFSSLVMAENSAWDSTPCRPVYEKFCEGYSDLRQINSCVESHLDNASVACRNYVSGDSGGNGGSSIFGAPPPSKAEEKEENPYADPYGHLKNMMDEHNSFRPIEIENNSQFNDSTFQEQN